MDLMYGCGSEYDISLQELIDSDLKSEMDRIMASGNPSDLMTELANQPIITDEGFDEFDIRFDGPHDRMYDPFGLMGIINPSGIEGVGTTTPRGNSKQTGGPGIGAWNSSHSSSLLHTGISFDEQYGIMVDPSSIVPVSVSGSTASSASSGSETDPECIATDEEDETELITGSLEGWIVPQQEVASRSPSPIGIAAEPEFELEEPEFILTEPPAEEPPTKKRKQKHEPQPHTDGKIYPKPAFSYSCLIAMALKNSKTGCLPVSEIYKFMCDHFPYFKSAPSGWKNSVRHNLSLNKCFEKIEKPGTGARKGCLWALNPAKVTKMEEEVQKWSRKDPVAIRRAMSDPENLELIEKGELKRDYSGNAGSDEDEEEDFSEPVTPSTPNLLQVRRPRPSSSESLISMVDSRVTSTTPSSVSQIRTNLLRPVDHKLHLKDDSLDFGTITNVQGNYLCHSSNGTNTYTLSFSSLHNSPAPLIIRRTPVK